MSNNKLEADGQNDRKQTDLENNPCGICRSQGLPVCKCKSASGGGGGSDGSEEKYVSLTPSLSAKSQHPINIPAFLDQTSGWTRYDAFDSPFKFESPDALFKMELDMERGTITISGNKGLSKEQAVALAQYLKAIGDELTAFKKEQAEHGVNTETLDGITMSLERNVLTMKFPSPKYYDAFVQRLIEKNLFPTNSAPQKEQTHLPETLKKPSQTVDQEQTYKSTAPNPFDITSGPKPKKGWE